MTGDNWREFRGQMGSNGGKSWQLPADGGPKEAHSHPLGQQSRPPVLATQVPWRELIGGGPHTHSLKIVLQPSDPGHDSRPGKKQFTIFFCRNEIPLCSLCRSTGTRRPYLCSLQSMSPTADLLAFGRCAGPFLWVTAVRPLLVTAHWTAGGCAADAVTVPYRG